MPHINRIRVNNVKYNFGTQYYDDFLMRFSGKNTIYDLANGGGKSVLMLLLLQNMIPNCTLDEKQPIEKLFRTGSGSTTIHSLVEWKLSEPHIKENYKYMLTGFCARKAKENAENEGEKETASIEYFNYCIFYREFNDNDIKNLPLKKGNERITYNGLKNYLRELEKTDLSLKIEIFERKGEYQRFIADYGIYESEWEIIRGINKTEGHVRTYFETNYKTTRKVVEDLLIEEIIQKSFNQKTFGEGREDIMAKTLIDIKDKLVELLKAREDIHNYDRQIEAVENFTGRVGAVKELYYGRDNLTEEIIRCYYTIKNQLKDKEDSIEACGRELDELLSAINAYKKDIETAKVLKETKELLLSSEELSLLEEKLAKEKENLKKLNEELVLKESINHYTDYLYYKKERDGLTVLVDNILKDKSELINELRELASAKLERDRKKQREILSEIEKEEKIILMENELTEELRNDKVKADKEMAVLEYLIEDYGKKIQEMGDNINKQKKNYPGILSFDLNRDQKQVRDEYDILLRNISFLEEELARASGEKESLILKREELKRKLKENEGVLSECIEKREKFNEIEEKAKKLCQVYGEKDFHVLKGTINYRYEESIKQQDELKGKQKELEEYYKGLSEGYPIPMSDEVEKIYNYIIRYHGNIVELGSEFVKALSLEKRKEVLEKNPLLPYAVIVKSDYHTIMSDMKLKELNATSHIVPIIRFDAIKNGDYCLDGTNLNFIMCNEELFYNKELIEKRQLKLKEEIGSVSFRLSQLEETIELLKKDNSFIEEYVASFMSDHEEANKQYESLKQIRKELEGESELVREKIIGVTESLTDMEGKLQEDKDKEKELLNDLEILKLLVEYGNEQNMLIRQQNDANNNYKSIKNRYDTVSARLEAQEKQLCGRREYVSSLTEDLQTIKNTWENEYKSYYREDVEAQSELDDMELEARFKGLKEAAESGSSDIQDKQKLINNYDLAMEKSLAAIDYNGIFVEDIKTLFEKGNAKASKPEELKTVKRKLEVLNSNINEISVDIAKVRTNRDKMEGSIERGKTAILEKYGKYEEFTLENEDYDGFISSRQEEIKQYDEKLLKTKEESGLLEKSRQKYEILKRDIDKIISNAKINVGSEEICLAGVFDIEEKITQIVEKNDKFLKEMYDKREEFENEKLMLVELLLKIGAEQLAEEIKANVTMPENISEADVLAEALSQINDCLSLEKDRLLKSIEDMNKIKENFENQCIQTCLNIKTELDRLPKLSKIYMDGETISIISLNIPYIKEEQYKLNMEKYIDETVNAADSMKNPAERLKYIRNQLSFKKLFSVIVSDMNAIKLNLYKRERIKEQSRYLKYEEAVGSTGQSQGIYIQFLIAIINYISNINSGSSESAGLKKVVFIDNPFGAAKDIYIWEPIFKLLKTNNVQLVVPARGTTPAITGRFDVNYILGQKLIDGRQQTVVVDYCSNVDNEQMDYETLKYEQTSLF